MTSDNDKTVLSIALPLTAAVALYWASLVTKPQPIIVVPPTPSIPAEPTPAGIADPLPPAPKITHTLLVAQQPQESPFEAALAKIDERLEKLETTLGTIQGEVRVVLASLKSAPQPASPPDTRTTTAGWRVRLFRKQTDPAADEITKLIQSDPWLREWTAARDFQIVANNSEQAQEWVNAGYYRASTETALVVATADEVLYYAFDASLPKSATTLREDFERAEAGGLFYGGWDSWRDCLACKVNPNLQAAAPDLSAMDTRLIAAINSYRAGYSLPPLTADPLLMQCARDRIGSLLPGNPHVSSRYGWAHEHARNAGFAGHVTDVVAGDFSSPEKAVWAWSQSDGHARALRGWHNHNDQWIDRKYNVTGVAMNDRYWLAVLGNK